MTTLPSACLASWSVGSPPYVPDYFIFHFLASRSRFCGTRRRPRAHRPGPQRNALRDHVFRRRPSRGHCSRPTAVQACCLLCHRYSGFWARPCWNGKLTRACADGDEESQQWETNFLVDDEVQEGLRSGAITLRLVAGSDEAGYLEALVSNLLKPVSAQRERYALFLAF